MQIIKQVNGEVTEHFTRAVEEKHLFKPNTYVWFSETNPYIELTIRDKKYIFGRWKFSPSEWQSVKLNAESNPVEIGRSYIEGTEEEHFIYTYKGLFAVPHNLLLT